MDNTRLADRILRAFAAGWNKIGGPARERARAAADTRWHEIGFGLELERDAAVRASWATLIGQEHVWASAGALPSLLRDPEEAVRAAAGKAMLAIGNAVGQGVLVGEPAAEALRVIASAAAAFDQHRSRDVLTALAAAAGTPGGLRTTGEDSQSALRDSGHPLHLAMRGAIRREEGMRAAAWAWLTQEPWRAACLDRLSQQGTAREHESVLGHAHLAMNPVRAAAAAMLADHARRAKATGRIPGPEMIPQLNEAARSALPRWMRLMRVDEAVRTGLLARFLSDESPRVRYAALIDAAADGNRELLIDFTFDPDERVARSALLRLMILRPPGAEELARTVAVLGSLVRSPHESVRRIASELLRVRGVMAGGAATVAMRRRTKRDRQGQITELAEAIERGSSEAGIAATLAARRLGVAAQLSTALVAAIERARGAADATAARLTATCASALGDADDPTAAAALGRCLGSRDARVRANAVEAFVRRARRTDVPGSAGGAGWERVMELKNDPHHRVKANVLRAWLEFAGDSERVMVRGMEQVGDMLSDPREMHRVAALWLAERMNLGGPEEAVSAQVRALGERVREMIGTDPDPRVRDRAVRVAARLAAQVREEWGASAADVSFAEVAL